MTERRSTTGVERADDARRELPTGCIELAIDYLERGWRSAGIEPCGARGVAEVARAHVLAPLIHEPDWPDPSSPLPAGDGFVHADLTDDDHELFASLRTRLAETGNDIDAESLASAAQEWRLAVTPYRTATDVRVDPSTIAPRRSAPSQPRTAPRAEPVVIDLSALWAGPLATSLLADLGARVIKVDPAARPDGLREHREMYRLLNSGKDIIDLDLRDTADRSRFEELLATADLLVDSFSRRVMPNFGYGRATLAERFPRLATLSIVAFADQGPEADWISYGPGVHAMSGLAHRNDSGGFKPAPLAYPDALAGLLAFATATEMLQSAAGAARAEISLAAAIAPLRARSIEPDPGRDQR